ncbi:hypothetical protein [Maridesulfovibrio salexigens]|uniref:Uncharacterized protein n=1 Tax=Maridesulfovibrio salexigens (strain ATCC 14822 / DSM 2638 / NCIMB 8403 / VKM B-1763) TaxID=526222 RepID=C6BSI8_MARSD|nr:hypothetical protein [Maridesulfovibrio salexigens]ACS81444.1 conserved hypothetical protein [Maridesulfovibrio salexigens DSM 2638]
MSESKGYDLQELAEEFLHFEPDNQFSSIDCEPFVQAMADPEPEFVIPFIKKRIEKGSDKKTAIRDLYAFFLDKRYYSRMNFLFFAFDVFCSKVDLPAEILEITPLPHEEGVPSFKHKLSPGYKVE